MDLGVSAALDLARRWQTKETAIRAYVFTNSQELQIKFAGHVTVFNDGIVLKAENGFELAITLLDEMTIKYGDGVLEIRSQVIGAFCMNRRINV